MDTHRSIHHNIVHHRDFADFGLSRREGIHGGDARLSRSPHQAEKATQTNEPIDHVHVTPQSRGAENCRQSMPEA